MSLYPISAPTVLLVLFYYILFYFIFPWICPEFSTRSRLNPLRVVEFLDCSSLASHRFVHSIRPQTAPSFCYLLVARDCTLSAVNVGVAEPSWSGRCGALPVVPSATR